MTGASRSAGLSRHRGHRCHGSPDPSVPPARPPGGGGGAAGGGRPPRGALPLSERAPAGVLPVEPGTRLRVSLGPEAADHVYTRVRDRQRNQEVPLATYQRLQHPRQADAGLFQKILLGLSCRDYRAAAEAVPEAFGLSPSTVSRRFIWASAKQLQALQERLPDGYDFVALVLLDGKTCAEDAMVLALGITVQGEKVLLGFVQTATENERVCAAFLREVVDRGLKADLGPLCVIDGVKGLRKAIQSAFGGRAVIQRCQWHKRENVVAHLPKGHHATWRRKLQQAYEHPNCAEARAALGRCRQELRVLNESAVKSLEEGLEDNLTLHCLGVFPTLGVSLKTTNCLESILALVARRTTKVTAWRTSDRKQRWLAAARLDIKPRLRRINQRIPGASSLAGGPAGTHPRQRGRTPKPSGVESWQRPLHNFNEEWD